MYIELIVTDDVRAKLVTTLSTEGSSNNIILSENFATTLI